MANKAPVTPKVIKWARESAKMTIEDAANKIGVPVEKFKQWEEGTTEPTINQAQAMAKLYKRSFALFFLTDPPYDFLPLQDYRKNATELSTASVFIIREIQERQAWISDVYQENDELALPFVGKFSITSSPEVVAADILKTLEIDPPKYETSNPVKEWVDKAEAKGIFVSRSSFIHTRMKFDSDEMKGFAIVDAYAPFVFINTEDWKAPQLFTLVHELAHIWIGESGISNDSDLRLRLKYEVHQVEGFCNEVAAIALMPTSSMNGLSKRIFNSTEEIFKVAQSWGVSSFAMLVRALHMNLITFDEYKVLKQKNDIAFQMYLKREETKRAQQKLDRRDSSGGPNPYLLQLNKNSRLFTQVVLDAYRSGSIPPTQASNLLNIKTNKFQKLEAFLYPQI